MTVRRDRATNDRSSARNRPVALQTVRQTAGLENIELRRVLVAEHAYDVLDFVRRAQAVGRRCALGIVVEKQGSSPRPAGAMIGVTDSGEYAGYVSNGCVDADVARQGLAALEDGAVRRMRYGAGSPYRDIRLPCGGGMELLLVPDPDAHAVKAAVQILKTREPVALALGDITTPAFAVVKTPADPSQANAAYIFPYAPPLQIALAGKGAEAIAFIRLARAAGYAVTAHSPEDEVLEVCEAAGGRPVRLYSAADAIAFASDRWTAIVCMFHDHEWEADLLMAALRTPAFYIGAMGGRKTQENRLAELRARGVEEGALARLRGPIGLIPSARDASTLAVSVLAEIVGCLPGAAADDAL